MCRLTCNALKILPVLASCALHSALIWLSPVMMKYQYQCWPRVKAKFWFDTCAGLISRNPHCEEDTRIIYLFKIWKASSSTLLLKLFKTNYEREMLSKCTFTRKFTRAYIIWVLGVSECWSAFKVWKYVIWGSRSNAVVMSRVYSSEPAQVWDLSGDPGFPAC